MKQKSDATNQDTSKLQTGCHEYFSCIIFEKPDTPLQTSLIAVDNAKGHEVLAGQSTTIKALNDQQDRVIYTPTAINKDAKRDFSFNKKPKRKAEHETRISLKENVSNKTS